MQSDIAQGPLLKTLFYSVLYYSLFTETVAQGPMANTVHNFWAMVQECDVHLIVMLTEVSGASKVDLKTCHLISSSDQVSDSQIALSVILICDNSGFCIHTILASERWIITRARRVHHHQKVL